MKKVTRKSVIPIYLAAAVWLVACLFLPMYRLWHYLVYALGAAAAFFVGSRLIPDTVEEVPMEEPKPDSGDPEVDSLILLGREQLKTLLALGSASHSPEIQSRTRSLEALGTKIFAALEQDTSRLKQTRKFLNYYLPTTVSLLRRYRTLEEQGAAGENITATMEKIRSMLSTVETAFQKQLDSLYEAEAMDVTAEIAVMQQIMAAEGLLEHEQDTI